MKYIMKILYPILSYSPLSSLMVLIGLQIFQLKKLKSNKQYRFSVLSTAIVLILTFFPLPMEKMYHYHLEQQRKEAVEVLLNAPEIKKLVVQGNPLKSQYVISYDLPEKYKHLSNGGEVTIKQNFIEFIEHGSGNFDFHYIIYSHNDNQPIVQYSTSEIEKVDPHWYSVHIVIENE